jgi:hypothetical protein
MNWEAVMFRVGQKVICVNDVEYPHAYGLPGMDGLTKGHVYTVREVGLSSWVDGRPAVRLAEIVRPHDDVPFWAHRFRPLVERKTDISVFKKLLDPATRSVVVE